MQHEPVGSAGARLEGASGLVEFFQRQAVGNERLYAGQSLANEGEAAGGDALGIGECEAVNH